MTQDLIILGFLKKQPASGYDIKKFIQHELGIFSGLESQSVYYCLERMARSGLIIKSTTRGAQRLKKYVYSLTPKGERAFGELCRKALLSQSRPFIELDIALYFLPFLNKEEILPLLRLRLRFLQKVLVWLAAKQHELKDSPRHLTLILEHHNRLATAEKTFLVDAIAALK